jgi:hypothetical protein
VVVHLLRELAGQLHRLDMRTKGTSEDALEEGLDLLLDIPEHGHARESVPVPPARESNERVPVQSAAVGAGGAGATPGHRSL